MPGIIPPNSWTGTRRLGHEAGWARWLPPGKTIGVWDGALRDYAPNHGNDYNEQLMAAGWTGSRS